jgi:hypothetical protein
MLFGYLPIMIYDGVDRWPYLKTFFWMVHDEFCQPPCEKLRHAVQVIQNGSAYEK